jgi:hypothetical protein
MVECEAAPSVGRTDNFNDYIMLHRLLVHCMEPYNIYKLRESRKIT